jgi:hypothetical protein
MKLYFHAPPQKKKILHGLIPNQEQSSKILPFLVLFPAWRITILTCKCRNHVALFLCQWRTIQLLNLTALKQNKCHNNTKLTSWTESCNQHTLAIRYSVQTWLGLNPVLRPRTLMLFYSSRIFRSSCRSSYHFSRFLLQPHWTQEQTTETGRCHSV